MHEQVMAQPPGVERFLRLATLADADAAWWGVLVEHATIQARWRTALAAREHALYTAHHWRHLAALLHEPVTEPTGMEASA